MGGAFVPLFKPFVGFSPNLFTNQIQKLHQNPSRGHCRGTAAYSPGLGMETGLSNLAFPLLNLSNIRSCDREEVDLQDKRREAEHERKTLEKTNQMEDKKCPVF